MYFSDESQLQSHLNEDCTILLRNLKSREDQHFQLLQYNRKIVLKQRTEDTQLFIKDELQQHQNHLKRLTDMQASIGPEQTNIEGKYEGTVVGYENVGRLMGRVGARVLETCQYSLDKCKLFDDQLMEKHAKMKTALIGLLNQKQQINLAAIFSLVSAYAKDKLEIQTQKLRKLIKALENGEYSLLGQVYVPKKKKIAISLQKKKVSLDKGKAGSLSKERSPAKQQAKRQEKQRKQKQKLATKMLTSIYSMLDLSKAQFMEDICGNEHEKSKRLYNQIFSRNKLNHQQIMAFEAKKDKFQEKVRLFKQRMLQESQKMTEVLIRKPIIQTGNQPAQVRFEQPIIIPQIEIQKTSVGQQSGRMRATRYRISSPKNKRDLIKDIPINLTSVYRSPNDFDHFRFDKQNQQVYPRTNRNRLPQIQNQSMLHNMRAESLDQKMQPIHKIRANASQQYGASNDPQNSQELRLQKIVKDEKSSKQQNSKEQKLTKQEKYMLQRKRMAIKNVQVGVQGVMSREQQGQRSKKQESNPMEYTFYVRKNRNQFFQPRHNIIL